MSRREPEPPPRFCPNCGAATVPGLSHCGACGQSLLPREEHERLWGRDAAYSHVERPDLIDLYPEPDLSLQTTTPFSQTRPFDPAERLIVDDGAAITEKPVDPWSASRGTLARTSAAPLAPAGVAASVTTSTERARHGPPGFVLGCLAIVLIAAVGVLLAWGAVRPAISNRFEDEIAVGITNELRNLDRIPAASSGRIRMTEATINEELQRNANLYEPVDDVHVAIATDAISIRFSLYGLTSTYRAGLDVRDGRIVIVDASLSGAAGRIVDEDEIGEIFETEVAALLQRSELQPTDVSLRNGSIVIVTVPAP